jgi:hypothetical protein
MRVSSCFGVVNCRAAIFFLAQALQCFFLPLLRAIAPEIFSVGEV